MNSSPRVVKEIPSSLHCPVSKCYAIPKNTGGVAADTAWLRIVDGSGQALEKAPAQTTMSLLPMAMACEDSSAGIQVAPMAKIRHSSQYALAVTQDDQGTGDLARVHTHLVRQFSL